MVARGHSLLSASTGFMRAARQAGTNPEIIPVSKDTSNARPTVGSDMVAGMKRPSNSVAGQAMARAINPPSRQMLAASLRNWIRMVRR